MNAFGQRLAETSAPALLVVDAILGFTDPVRPLGSEADAVVAGIAELLAAARAGGRPVAFTTISYRTDLADAGLWSQKIPALADLVEGTEAVLVDPRLDRRDGDALIVKKGASAARDTHLLALLASWRCDSVVVCGLTTSGCVRASAVDLLHAGYAPLVVRECVGDRDQAAHEGSLRDLELKYADVVGLDEAAARLRAAP